MRVKVDYDKCESNGLCVAAAPGVFEIRDDDVMYVLIPEPAGENEARVRQAVRACPKQALSITEP